MQSILLTTQNAYPMATCEQEFNVSHTRFERVVSGIKRAGGREYTRKRKLGPDEMPVGASKPKAKKQNPVDKGQTGLTPKETACKYCGKVCYSDKMLSVHINNEHSDRQSVFQCVFCGLKFNEFRLYEAHLEKHDKDMYKCYACQKQFNSARELRVHVHMHINQCSLCSRCFESLLVLSKHVNKAHGAALSEEKKQCLYCDTAFKSFVELGNHSNQSHHDFFCDVCFVGFVSEPLLVEHRVNDHPTGQPGEPGEHSPSMPAVQTEVTPDIEVTREVDPELVKAMDVVCTPKLDPFADKWHPAVGQVKQDGKHKVQCEQCHRYLKSNKMRVEHVMQFHPWISYDCKFCPGLILNTTRDLFNHCKNNHLLCNLCNSALKDQNALRIHNNKHHKKPPAAAAKPVPQPSAQPSPQPSVTWSNYPPLYPDTGPFLTVQIYPTLEP